ncbi:MULTISPECIES: SGNH/GDSL hydrolase family protein [unclassified Enterococcus]|uniref:SGNH/GDSL hydrolase family protein n=1 Tax=unclassified Enterococcus TaxID=2608891 RepID=UPI001CE13F88|nr:MULTISPECIES: SGNH/GDSL hydrolase family protein [unclassified Enterococcus]MCA5012791.1 SGNH/GDSL hydrolase family protein [Enterococcus sp. S23]MCA5016042.1 SGNH/GDSL hydrolase family protein [Enterococcus sp. S22(2020)]
MNYFFQKNWRSFAIFFATIISVFLLLMITIPKAKPILGTGDQKTEKRATKEVIHYAAIGDSLTEGIGDLTNSGGFVPLVANDLQEEYHLNGVQTDNFGKNGDRSDQILKRIKKKEEIQTGLASADLISLTVGGNDLMKVIKGDVFRLTQDSFKKPLKKYQSQVEQLLAEIRKYNPEAPIYVVGIYNPFYLYFPEITEMQDIVDNWNEGTKEIVEAEGNSYFIPINDLLYKGVDDQVGIVSADQTTSSSENRDIKNNALYEEDRFHPNNLGYQLMASAIRDEMVKTNNKWLEKGSE